MTRRSVTAVMLLLASVAGLVLPCLCAPMAAAHQKAADHSCCAQEPPGPVLESPCCTEHAQPLSKLTWTFAAAVPGLVPALPVPVVRPEAVLAVRTGVAPARPVVATPPLRI